MDGPKNRVAELWLVSRLSGTRCCFCDWVRARVVVSPDVAGKGRALERERGELMPPTKLDEDVAEERRLRVAPLGKMTELGGLAELLGKGVGKKCLKKGEISQ